jgi:hypothetical protein
MTSEKVKTILSKQGIASAKNELAFFFRRICSELKFDPIRWEGKLQRWLDRNKSLIGSTSKDRSYARGNMNSQFTADKLTWRTFMDSLRFIGAVGAHLTLELEWAGKRKTYHQIKLNLKQGNTQEETADDEEMLEELSSSVIGQAPIPLSVDESIERAQREHELSSAIPEVEALPSVEEQLKRHTDTLRQARSKLRASSSGLRDLVDEDEAPTDTDD